MHGQLTVQALWQPTKARHPTPAPKHLCEKGELTYLVSVLAPYFLLILKLLITFS